MKKYLIVLLIVLALGGIYLFSVKYSQRLLPQPIDDDGIMLGGDRDEHGCIGSAGYSWCEAKKRCLREWEENCSGTPTPYDETELILKGTIKDLMVKKYGEAGKNLEVTVSEINGEYAKGSATEMGTGGGMWFAAKKGGEWKLIWDGNGIITCKDIKDYLDFPTSMIPQCFDDSKKEMITR